MRVWYAYMRFWCVYMCFLCVLCVSALFFFVYARKSYKNNYQLIMARIIIVALCLLMPATMVPNFTGVPRAHRANRDPLKGINRENILNILNISKIIENHIFALYGTWEALVARKILPRGVWTICPPGKHISRKSIFRPFSRISCRPIYPNFGLKTLPF